MTVFKSVFQHCECIKTLNAGTVKMMLSPRILITEKRILGVLGSILYSGKHCNEDDGHLMAMNLLCRKDG